MEVGSWNYELGISHNLPSSSWRSRSPKSSQQSPLGSQVSACNLPQPFTPAGPGGAGSPAPHWGRVFSLCLPRFRCSVCPACHGESAESRYLSTRGPRQPQLPEGLFPRSCDLPKGPHRSLFFSENGWVSGYPDPSSRCFAFYFKPSFCNFRLALMKGASLGHERRL